MVTGASTGIGRATAEHLAQAGFQVLAGVRTDAAAEAVEVVLVEPGAIATPIWEKGLATARGLTETMTADQRQRYRQITAAASRRAQQAARDGVPPEQVAQVITEAVTARRPRTRELVGRDARITARVAALLPDRVMDRIVSGRAPRS